jgi:aryl-alcohol dehydrogenase-like predicted oxidoreductase
VVREALVLGITHIDTAEAYGTETAVGMAVPAERRGEIVICTKVPSHSDDGPLSAETFRERAMACLQRLNTPYIDVLYVHGVTVEEYEHAHTVLLPAIERMCEEGLVRAAGITEAFGRDTGHEMLAMAVKEPRWKVMMVGLNLMNQSARERVLKPAEDQGIGVTIMFAVRRSLRDMDALMAVRNQIADRLPIPPDEEPLDQFLARHGITSIPDTAYRFCRYEPGVDVVLTGTGNIEHLRSNVQSINADPLPEEVAERLKREFAGVDYLSGN